MNRWAEGFFGRPIIGDWREQLDFTTKIFRCRGLHLDDRHVREAGGTGFSASIVDLVLYVANNAERLLSEGSSVVLYLPKIQTAEEAALWNDMLTALEKHLGLDGRDDQGLRPGGAARGHLPAHGDPRRAGQPFRRLQYRPLGLHQQRLRRLCWDPDFVNPNIDSIVMTYGYMRNYEDRVRRAVNTPDRNGNFALWQGGMEPNIPVGSNEGVAAGMKRAVAGAVREQREGASGKWVAHWKMVHIIRPVWEEIGEANQLGRSFPPLTYTAEDAADLITLNRRPAPYAAPATC